MLLEILSGIGGCAALAVVYVKYRVHRDFNCVLLDFDAQCKAAETLRSDDVTPPVTALPPLAQLFLDRGRSAPFPTRLTFYQDISIKLTRDGAFLGPSACTQRVCTRSTSPAFVFSGAFPMDIPGASVRGYECLVNGRGRAEWRAWGVVSLASMAGPLADSAGLVRWLAEMAGCPAGLQPSEALTWQSVDGKDDEAQVTLTCGDRSVNARYRFDDAGRVVWFRSEDYSRGVPGGGAEQCPMVGVCGEYADFEVDIGKGALPLHLSLPTLLEGRFVEPDGDEWTYIKVRLTGVEAG